MQYNAFKARLDKRMSILFFLVQFVWPNSPRTGAFSILRPRNSGKSTYLHCFYAPQWSLFSAPYLSSYLHPPRLPSPCLPPPTCQPERLQCGTRLRGLVCTGPRLGWTGSSERTAPLRRTSLVSCLCACLMSSSPWPLSDLLLCFFAVFRAWMRRVRLSLPRCFSLDFSRGQSVANTPLVSFGITDSNDSALPRRRYSDPDFHYWLEVDSSLLELDDCDGVRRRFNGILYLQSSSETASAALSGACVGVLGRSSGIGGSRTGRSGRRTVDCKRLPTL